jgi:cyclopropane-fatty-acyl-phospholipid synthase
MRIQRMAVRSSIAPPPTWLPPLPTFTPSLSAIIAGLRHLRGGTLHMHLPDGRTLSFGDGDGPSATIVVHNRNFARRVLVTGDIGFAEGWIEREWDSPDLFALLTLLCANGDHIARFIKGNSLGKFLGSLAHAARTNTREGARSNILAHYDLGNAFYETWLDESMTYSAARFANGAANLEEAQREKYRAMAHLADLKPGEHVLEIGCGWGGFAEFAAKEIGARVTAVTISDAQYAYASSRMQRAGVSDRVQVLRQDYRDIAGQFDKIVSIEMFEAVGEAYWPAFFGKLAAALKPGGRAALQVITVRNDLFASYRTRVDFVQRYVFPGGMLPSETALKRAAGDAGFSFARKEHAGEDYRRTLVAWADRFRSQRPAIRAQGFDERFERFWLFYLAYCAAGFATSRTDVLRVALSSAWTARCRC